MTGAASQNLCAMGDGVGDVTLDFLDGSLFDQRPDGDVVLCPIANLQRAGRRRELSAKASIIEA